MAVNAISTFFNKNNIQESTAVPNAPEQTDSAKYDMGKEPEQADSPKHGMEKKMARMIRHPGQIFTPEEIQKLINSPTGNWFKRLVANLQMAFLAARELMERSSVGVTARGHEAGRDKSRRAGQAQPGEPEKPAKLSSLFEKLKNFFAEEYDKLLKLTQSLTDVIQFHDRNVHEWVNREFPALVQALRGLEVEQLREINEGFSDAHKPELKLDEEALEAAFRAHRKAFPASAPSAEALESEMRPGFARALRERFEDKSDITKEDACCALVEHEFMSRVGEQDRTVQQDTPVYRFLQQSYQQTLLNDSAQAQCFEEIAALCRTCFAQARTIEREQQEVTARLDAELRSDNPEAARAQVETLNQNQFAPRIQQAMGALRNVYAPRPPQPSGRRLEEEQDLQQRSSTPTPFSTRPAPPGGWNGSAGG